MADELQALFDRIDKEAIRKAEADKAKILADAKAEAERIVAQANEEAAQAKAAAAAEAETMRKKSEEALRQAGREILLEVRGEFERRVAGAVASLLKATLKPEALAGILATVCGNYLAKNGSTDDISALVPAEQLAVLEDAVKAQLAAELKAKVSLAPSKALSGGFQLKFNGADVVYDFSDAALAEAIAAHLSPALGALITQPESAAPAK